MVWIADPFNGAFLNFTFTRVIVLEREAKWDLVGPSLHSSWQIASLDIIWFPAFTRIDTSLDSV